jgi:hypothetical protein
MPEILCVHARNVERATHHQHRQAIVAIVVLETEQREVPDVVALFRTEPGTDENDLSEYEHMRLANIQRNNALLESLDIQAGVLPIAGSRMPRPLPAQAPKSAGGSSALPEASVRGMRFWPTIKVICPWGFKGGIYKTTTTINTAVALAGKRQNSQTAQPCVFGTHLALKPILKAHGCAVHIFHIYSYAREQGGKRRIIGCS